MFPSDLCVVLPDLPASIEELWTLTSAVLTETVGEDEIEQTFREFHRDGIPFVVRYQPAAEAA